MPELPEVEVVRRGLADAVSGRTITTVEVLHPRAVRRHLRGPQDFALTLSGRRLVEPRRRGKYLWLPFADGDALSAHLGMSGQFRVDDPDQPRPPHTRVVIRFSDEKSELRFADQRMFGGLWLSPEGADGPAEIGHIAPDLFDPDVNRAELAARIRAKRAAIKRVLLDQSVVSGIGNIYADEALWASRLHYATSADRLATAQIEAVLVAAADVMHRALATGGTSFDALYVNVFGGSGYFARDLEAYGRAELPCVRCGTLIVRERFMNRSSYRCPQCQPAQG